MELGWNFIVVDCVGMGGSLAVSVGLDVVTSGMVPTVLMWSRLEVVMSDGGGWEEMLKLGSGERHSQIHRIRVRAQLYSPLESRLTVHRGEMLIRVMQGI